LSKAFVTKISV